jgi:hypothetical protein
MIEIYFVKYNRNRGILVVILDRWLVLTIGVSGKLIEIWLKHTS